MTPPTTLAKLLMLKLPTAALLPKLRAYFAEFLNASSLVRLRFLIPPTCVGLRYGLPGLSQRGLFLGALITPASLIREQARCRSLSKGVSSTSINLLLRPGQPSPGRVSPHASSLVSKNGTGI